MRWGNDSDASGSLEVVMKEAVRRKLLNFFLVQVACTFFWWRKSRVEKQT